MSQCSYKIGGRVQCRQNSYIGSEYCAYHRGAVPHGSDHHNFNHGRYSKDLPRGLMEKFIAAASDPDILSLSADVALIDARLSEILSRLKDDTLSSKTVSNESPADDSEVKPVNGKSAKKSSSPEVDALVSSAIIWDEVEDRLKLRKELVESERRRLVEAGQTITTAQLMALLRSISVVIKTHVTDPVALSKIAAGVADLIDANAPQAEYIGFEVIPVEKRRWSHKNDDGTQDMNAPITPVENLDSRTNMSAARNGFKNPVDPETGIRKGYNPTSLRPAHSGGLGDRPTPALRDPSHNSIGGSIYGTEADSKRTQKAVLARQQTPQPIIEDKS